jgi:hypothetical protein
MKRKITKRSLRKKIETETKLKSKGNQIEKPKKRLKKKRKILISLSKNISK